MARGGSSITVAEQNGVEGGEDGAGEDVSPAALALTYTYTDAAAVVPFLLRREHVVHAHVLALPAHEIRQGRQAIGAAAVGRRQLGAWKHHMLCSASTFPRYLSQLPPVHKIRSGGS